MSIASFSFYDSLYSEVHRFDCSFVADYEYFLAKFVTGTPGKILPPREAANPKIITFLISNVS